jgi:hypothetical protein
MSGGAWHEEYWKLIKKPLHPLYNTFIFKLLWLRQQLKFENCFTSRVDGLGPKRYTSGTRWSIAGHKFQVLWWFKHVTECTRYRLASDEHTLVWTFFHATKRQKLTSQQTYAVHVRPYETGQGQVRPPTAPRKLDRHGEQATLFVPTWTSGWRRLQSIHFVSWILNQMNTVSALNTLIETLWVVTSLNAITFPVCIDRVLPCNHGTMYASRQQSLVPISGHYSNWMPSLFGVYDSTLNPVCRPPDGSYVPLPLCHRFDLLLRNLAYLYQSNATVKFLAVLLNHSRIQRFLVKFIWNFRPPGLPQPVHITHIIICRQALHKDKVRLSHPRRVRISACSIYSADYAHKDRSG